MTANVKVDGIKDREQLYKLVIGQLYYDGYESVAASLAKVVRLQGALTPSDRLLRLTKLALVTEEGTKQNSLTKERVAPGGGIDLEFESDVVTISPEAALYETCYVTSHKAQCRASAFTCDGQLIATGSVDASIKVLDVDRMLAKSAQAPEQAAQETPQQNMENHPVIRTLYDHIEEVTCLDYHPQYPNVQLLASGSKDYTVKFFDFTKPSVKRATKSIQEADVVRCLSFHPSGDFILVGTQHPTLRLYDSNTLQCFVSCNPADQHKAAISAVKYSPNANLYVSCSKDGDIKVWDGVSNRCIATYTRAHDGEEAKMPKKTSKTVEEVIEEVTTADSGDGYPSSADESSENSGEGGHVQPNNIDITVNDHGRGGVRGQGWAKVWAGVAAGVAGESVEEARELGDVAGSPHKGTRT
ncbi:cleavage stimulation factor subunit 1-like isoform X3 [Branchiostoma floridae]|uniref:Cleavage stimulation factor 50 kDa subunit n=1 Tax=Branchiostoma floridae TaxID=7739 RepID=A0A9J7MAN6_BRAFL|nr:cleavage stimulation factor subunit 1-like isoform X3 [Branchiostoma floridae]